MKWAIAMALLLVVTLPESGRAAAAAEWELGVRAGMEATGSNEHYQAGELYLLRALPARVETPAGPVSARLDLGVSYLDGGDDDQGYLVAAGGDLVWIPGNGPVELEAGFRPAWLSDHRFGEDDYGGGLQFVSHAGVALRLSPLVISYRYLHMSNAGIYNENDGLNLHLFGVGAAF